MSEAGVPKKKQKAHETKKNCLKDYYHIYSLYTYILTTKFNCNMGANRINNWKPFDQDGLKSPSAHSTDGKIVDFLLAFWLCQAVMFATNETDSNPQCGFSHSNTPSKSCDRINKHVKHPWLHPGSLIYSNSSAQRKWSRLAWRARTALAA